MKKTNAFFTNITMYSYIRIPLNQLQIMNQKFKRNVFFLFLFLFFGIGNAQITIASDNAGNYGSWTNGSNGGTGFGPWTISTGAKTGVFIGSPSNDGMGTSGIGTTAFGLWATGNKYVNATRDLLYPMQIGDEFSFYWATNWDPNGGSKGIDLRDSSNNNIITLLHSGTFSANNIVASGSLTATISTNYGVEPMLVTITRTSGTQYTINITRRKTSDGTYTSTFNSSVAISRINLFNGNTNQTDGKRNTYFNNFIQKRPNTPTILLQDLFLLFQTHV